MQTLLAPLPDFLVLLVNLTIIAGAVVAAYKFQVFDVLAHRFRSEVWCTSTPVGDGKPGRFLFVGNYVIHNTGERPLKVTKVTLQLLEPFPEDRVIDSDRTDKESPLAERVFETDAGTSWFKIRGGERSIYPIRAYVDRIDGPVVFLCTFHWKHRGDPSEFAWLYDPRLPMTWSSEPTPALPEAYDPSSRRAPSTRTGPANA